MSLDPSSSVAPRYTIQHTDTVNFSAGRTEDGKQVILGVPGSFLAAVFFDAQGNFLRCETRKPHLALPVATQQAHKPGGDLLAQLWASLDTWKSEIGFSPSTIVVSCFSVSDLGLGITELPHYLQDLLDHPSSEPDETLRQEYFAEIAEWHRQNKFVLRWGNEYWMNSSGEVTDT
jgi:hypothetical protein